VKIWTFDYDPSCGSTSPIETSCEDGTFGYPRLDAEGRTMFVNSHFRTKGEAWKALRNNAAAHQSMLSTAYRDAQAHLRRTTDDLAKVASFTSEVERAFERDKDQA